MPPDSLDISSNRSLSALLHEGASLLGVSLTTAQQAQLLDYVALLAKWNAVYNLTAIRDPQQMLIQHVLDSLSIIPHLATNCVDPLSSGVRNPGSFSALDVGAGGGLPGLVMAIVMPDWQITLNDIVQKKVAFLTQAKGLLKLDNVTVVSGRIETLRLGKEIQTPFTTIVSRAFAPLPDFVKAVRHLLASNGTILAMKGHQPDAELVQLPKTVIVKQILRLNVPFLQAERHLIQLTVTSS
jgi:16S rRNA (guanine527-N7)-methyltransferase